jgi:hypothetical protein
MVKNADQMADAMVVEMTCKDELDENDLYVELCKERQEYFTLATMDTKPLNPEAAVAHWPDDVERQTYFPIFVNPWKLGISNNEMSIMMRTHSCFDTFENIVRNADLSEASFEQKMEEFTKNLVNISADFANFKVPATLDDQFKEYYKKSYGFHMFSITDKAFDRPSRTDDCFDLKFWNLQENSSHEITRTWIDSTPNRRFRRTPTMVTREFLKDAAKFVEHEQVRKTTMTPGDWKAWAETFTTYAVLRELVRAAVRDFKYMSDVGKNEGNGLDLFREWVASDASEHPRGGMFADAADIHNKANMYAYELLREVPWWYLYAAFVGYAHHIRFPEHRHALRTRLSTSSPPVWPLPDETRLTGFYKANPRAPVAAPAPVPVSTPPAPAPVSTPPAPAPVSTPPTQKLYRKSNGKDNRRATFD